MPIPKMQHALEQVAGSTLHDVTQQAFQGRSALAEVGATLVDTLASSSEFGPNLDDPGPTLDVFGRIPPISVHVWSKPSQIWPTPLLLRVNSPVFCPSSADIWPNVADSWPTLVEVRTRPHIRPDLN